MDALALIDRASAVARIVKHLGLAQRRFPSHGPRARRPIASSIPMFAGRWVHGVRCRVLTACARHGCARPLPSYRA
jgi:hypothetical protein